MNLNQTFRHLFAALTASLALTACDNSFIFEDEGDCDPKYRVKLRYDYNMKFADAFASEVDHVTVNVVDSDGKIVYTHRESGEQLRADNYEIILDGKLAPGNYQLHAWCGSGAEPGNSSFVVHPAERLEELRCTLLPDVHNYYGRSAAEVPGAEGDTVKRSLENLYHGLTEQLCFPDDEGTYNYTVPLTKNTNSVKVMLQNLNQTPLNHNDFIFTITSDNARMAHDNSIIEAEPVVYQAWDVRDDIIGDVAPADSINGGRLQAVVAEFTVGRLMADENVRLEAHRVSDGQLAFSVDMVNLALLLKSANLRSMSDQEFLDRQDEYNYIFFLDSRYTWSSCQVNILSWKMVIQNQEI